MPFDRHRPRPQHTSDRLLRHRREALLQGRLPIDGARALDARRDHPQYADNLVRPACPARAHTGVVRRAIWPRINGVGYGRPDETARLLFHDSRSRKEVGSVFLDDTVLRYGAELLRLEPLRLSRCCSRCAPWGRDMEGRRWRDRIWLRMGLARRLSGTWNGWGILGRVEGLLVGSGFLGGEEGVLMGRGFLSLFFFCFFV